MGAAHGSKLMTYGVRRRPPIRAAVWGVGCALAVLLAAGRGDAHPIHTSLGEAEWNAETGCLEVALRVFPDDLELALTKSVRRPVNLQRDAARLDQWIVPYLKRHFVLQRQGTALPIRWVGKEVSAKEVWLYFEIPAQDLEHCQCRNTLLCDVLSDQRNTVVITDGARIATVISHRDQPAQAVAFTAGRTAPAGATSEPN